MASPLTLFVTYPGDYNVKIMTVVVDEYGKK